MFCREEEEDANRPKGNGTDTHTEKERGDGLLCVDPLPRRCISFRLFRDAAGEEWLGNSVG